MPPFSARAHRARLAVLFVFPLAMLAGCEQKSTVDPARSEVLIRPVARFEFQSAEQAAPGERSGEEVYKAICTTCHSLGTLDAPKTGDVDAWAPRIATGFETLVQSVINGKGVMPPRAGIELSDSEVRRAVAWLANQAGASFAESDAAAAPSEQADADATEPSEQADADFSEPPSEQ